MANEENDKEFEFSRCRMSDKSIYDGHLDFQLEPNNKTFVEENKRIICTTNQWHFIINVMGLQQR